MFRNERKFIKELLTESDKDTVIRLIDSFKLPLLLRRTLIEMYVDGLEIKQIAFDRCVDDRTIKRQHAKALDLCEERAKARLLMSL